MTIRAVIIGIIVFVVAVVGLILIFPVGNEQQNRQPSPHALDQSNWTEAILETLRIFRLLPVVDEADPRWGNADNQGEVTVRAYSAADARLVAAEAEDDFLEMNVAPQMETPRGCSVRFATKSFIRLLKTSRVFIRPRVPEELLRET
jgi:hypothetical protein